PGPAANRGCPWPDTDGDGIPDKDDRCPTVPGPRENQGCPWPDTDGDGIPDKDDACPTVPGPRENRGWPWPATDGDGLPATDDVGGAKSNMKPSQRRAESVRKYLVKKGVAPSRLLAKGYGLTKPLKPVDKKKMTKEQLAEARGQNRRVQFIIVKQ